MRKLKKLSSVVILIFVSCGDDNPTRTTTTSAPPQPVTTLISQGSTSLRSFFVTIPHRNDARGDVEFIVDWTFEESFLWIYVTDGFCTADQFRQDACPFRVRSETRQPKPRRLRVANREAGQMSLIVWNVGEIDESISWQGLLTTTGPLDFRRN